MLEVNNFDAIRISLASPEQIKSWSSGEVTKPETINYRTLKPEKDGLFDERIFGPTKDWECYCGKYKRIRYKGIICDKCGVEVTRSKVRRERMGHIKLASPVSHIWYFKGTPSRLGILLDVSPRNLERILYFALYVVNRVDEQERDRALARVDEELKERIARAQSVVDEKRAELEAAVADKRAELDAAHAADLTRLDEQQAARSDELATAAQALEAAIKGAGKELAEDVVFAATGEVIARAGTTSKEALATLRKVMKGEIEAVDRDTKEAKASAKEKYDTAVADLTGGIDEALASEREQVARDTDDARLWAKSERQAIDSIKIMQTLTESEYRNLSERHGRLFDAGMGAEAVKRIIEQLNLDDLAQTLHVEMRQTSGQRRKKAIKRLRLIEAFRKSGARPEWMILTTLPVIPPDLRPMVQLDGGRFATSDLNDLYRRVINRNNRLSRLLDLEAPEIIIRNEKRMLQEACDALIDNGRRGRAIAGTGNHRLKSLSDMLKGKQGRFRQNLLGKRVDYSGRSVIVVGPELKLHQCGLPKKMALELFKPFVMRQLVEKGFAHNIKSAKRIVERVRPEVWDVLEEVIEDHPVLLNRAPTLHRLGIQAFMPTLVEGSAIQIHPLVCFAFNADFDGDQMAVHVPLSSAAQKEAKELMLSTQNLLSAADGAPVVSPTHDMVLGCYYLTVGREDLVKPGAKPSTKKGAAEPAVRAFIDDAEVYMALQEGALGLHDPIDVETDAWEGDIADGAAVRQRMRTTPGRVVFNSVLPPQLRFANRVMDRKGLRALIADCHRRLGPESTTSLVDGIKTIGFHYATVAGITISIDDVKIPASKVETLRKADGQVDDIDREFRRGFITEDERYAQTVEVWRRTTDKVTEDMLDGLDRDGSVWMITHSGARGNVTQVHQLAGMRGLMADPSGRIIDLPIRSNLREGMSVLEYFISSHGARKGLADTALRTADSGYLTRRLVDVAQDVITREDDCGTDIGTWITTEESQQIPEPFEDRLVGRMAALDVVDEKAGETIVARNEELTEAAIQRIIAAGIERVSVRAPLTCVARHGVCRMCYGRDLATGRLVELGQAVGIIAAQSIGEPGTQLTMRTFHTGGVAGEDITQGLPRVEELFEARIPKGQATISEIDGEAEVVRAGAEQPIVVRVTHREAFKTPMKLTPQHEILVANGDEVTEGQLLARLEADGEVTEVKAPAAGRITKKGTTLTLDSEDVDTREYAVGHSARLRVDTGDSVAAGDALTEGSLNPKELLAIKGVDAVQRFLVTEVQKVYRSQGVSINDKHVEIIVRQMLRKVMVDSAGDTELLPSELIDRFEFEETNNRILAEGGEPATAQTVLLGVTKASLNTSSFLAAASFQETTRVLTEAAINGAKDHLLGLKENVIIGKLIPAGTGAEARRLAAERALLGTPEEQEELREAAAARAFLSGDPDSDGDGVVEADEAEAAATEAGDAIADLMDAGSNPEMEAAVEEAVFDELNEEPVAAEAEPAAEPEPEPAKAE
ncbi:MAG TPA: DNA-directed RNA polymerase subunit beta' [Candidatus Limnocylindria bacterium]|nr:DNA-directed RNA polymerase subunit beta' [Candidatus Limnocylindria bacterium]